MMTIWENNGSHKAQLCTMMYHQCWRLFQENGLRKGISCRKRLRSTGWVTGLLIYKLRDLMKDKGYALQYDHENIWKYDHWPQKKPALAKSSHEICAVCLTRYPWEQGIGANNQKHFLLFLTYTSLHCLGVAPMTLGQHWLDVAEKQTMTMTCVYGVWNWKNCLAVLLSNKNEDCWKSELRNIQGVCGVSLRYIHLQEKKIPYTQQSHGCIFRQSISMGVLLLELLDLNLHPSEQENHMTAKMLGKHLLDQSEASLEKTHRNLCFACLLSTVCCSCRWALAPFCPCCWRDVWAATACSCWTSSIIPWRRIRPSLSNCKASRGDVWF